MSKIRWNVESLQNEKVKLGKLLCNKNQSIKNKGQQLVKRRNEALRCLK